MVVPLAFGWRDLLFANWRVDPSVLDAHLPDALSVQTRDGDGWLTVVPLRNVDTRPRGLPAAIGLDLPELNLRTYVVRDGVPGIYFFSLDVASVLATLGARLTHHLPYYYARIQMDRRASDDRVEFRNRRRHPGARPAAFAATYRPTGESFAAEPDSLTEFLTERRRLYTQDASGTLRYTDVTHARWRLREVDLTVHENTLFEATGFDRPDGDPLCYYSPGVDVVTSRSKRWQSP